jgi:hypothetical protein
MPWLLGVSQIDTTNCKDVSISLLRGNAGEMRGGGCRRAEEESQKTKEKCS